MINSVQLGKACGIDGIPNELPRHLSIRLLVRIIHLFNHWPRLSHFPSPWKEAKVITLPKPIKDPLRTISLLSMTAKFFEEAILRIFQRNLEE